MARSHDRGRRGEQRVEAVTGARRVKNRPRYVSMPDFWPLRLASGHVVQLESKAGANVVPRKVLKDLAQARGYTPEAVGVVVYLDVGGPSVACLSLEDLARLLRLGKLQTLPEQMPLSRAVNDATEGAGDD